MPQCRHGVVKQLLYLYIALARTGPEILKLEIDEGGLPHRHQCQNQRGDKTIANSVDLGWNLGDRLRPNCLMRSKPVNRRQQDKGAEDTGAELFGAGRSQQNKRIQHRHRRTKAFGPKKHPGNTNPIEGQRNAPKRR